MAAYQPHNWQAGQTITAERLNALEQGLAKTQDETGEPVEALPAQRTVSCPALIR